MQLRRAIASAWDLEPVALARAVVVVAAILIVFWGAVAQILIGIEWIWRR